MRVPGWQRQLLRPRVYCEGVTLCVFSGPGVPEICVTGTVSQSVSQGCQLGPAHSDRVE